MLCEVCEKPVVVGKRVKLEGSIVVTCDECAKLGEVVGVAAIQVKKEKPIGREEPKPEEFEVKEEWELADNYNEVVRKARERSGLKQEELGKLVNEPASLIQRIESGKAEPNPELGRKLENKLDIRLFRKSEGVGADIESKNPDDVTFGDVVVVRKRK